jgi:hypothetical protein
MWVPHVSDKRERMRRKRTKGCTVAHEQKWKKLYPFRSIEGKYIFSTVEIRNND